MYRTVSNMEKISKQSKVVVVFLCVRVFVQLCYDKEKIKKELSRRLSQRPNVEVLKKKKILKFEEYVDVYEVTNYERKAEKPWTKLTPEDKANIRKELNEYKVISKEYM